MTVPLLYRTKRIFLDVFLGVAEDLAGVFKRQRAAGGVEGEGEKMTDLEARVMRGGLIRIAREKVNDSLFVAVLHFVSHLAAEIADDLGADRGLLPGLAQSSLVLGLARLNVPLREPAIGVRRLDEKIVYRIVFDGIKHRTAGFFFHNLLQMMSLFYYYKPIL